MISVQNMWFPNVFNLYIGIETLLTDSMRLSIEVFNLYIGTYKQQKTRIRNLLISCPCFVLFQGREV